VPSQQEVRWSQLKVGVLVLMAIIALTALVFLMSGSTGGIFSKKLTVHSYFENSAGLKVGGPVNLEGVTIGTVKTIRIVTDPKRKLTPVEVVMKISADYAGQVRQDSKASLETVGVLGDTVVDISSKAATLGPIAENGELPTNETPSLSDVIKSSQGTIEQLNTILAKVDTVVDAVSTGKGSIGQLIQNPDLYNKAAATVTELQGLVDKVANGQGSIGKLVSDDTLYNHVNDIVTRLDDVSKQIDSGQGSVGKLIKDPTLYNNLQQSTDSLNKLLADVNAGKGGLGMIAKDPAFAAKLNDTVTRLDSILARADNGEGTLGQLVRNPSLYNHADETIANVNHLVTAIRENPKTYLTFHVKIF
jgi:phospholipid/cholesterol/gamma-HCH transport system substrate-binding protein